MDPPPFAWRTSPTLPGSAARILIITVGIMLAVMGCSVPMARAEAAEPPPLRVVVDADYAPFSFQSGDGEVQGIVVDQWQAWSRQTGRRVEIRAMDWSQALRRMQAGEFDVIDSIVETPGRRAYFDFAAPHATVEASLYFHEGIPGITDLESLRGFAVGMRAGDQLIDRVKSAGVKNVVRFRNNSEVIFAARDRKINVFLIDDRSALYLLNEHGLADRFRRSEPVFRDELRRAVRKQDAATLRAVVDGFAAVGPEELRRIEEKWHGQSIPHNHGYLTYGLYAVLAAVLLMLGMGLWNRTLRKAIAQRTAALRESERRFRQITESIRQVFWMSAPAMSELLYVSPAYESIWGRSMESLRQQPRSFLESVHEDDREGVTRVVETEWNTGFEIVYRIVRPDGEVRWIRDRGFPVRDESGKAIRTAGLAEDITDAMRVSEALRQSEQDLAEAQRTAHLGNWTFDVEKDAIRWSDEMYRIFEIEKASGPPTIRAFLSRVDPADRSRVEQAIANTLASGEAFEIEYQIVTRDGRLKHVRDIGHARIDEHGAIGCLFGTAQDITEYKSAWNALRESSSQLQALSRRLVALQESERKELARELHDRIGQNLTALNINLSMLDTTVRPNASDEIRSRLSDSESLVEATAAAVRDVLTDLRPPMLDDHGLLAALDWYTRTFSARSGVEVELVAQGASERAAPETEIALFRIAQEILNNVAKHSQARRVDMGLGWIGAEYVMTVQDDGVGFDSAAADDVLPMGLGMVTMRERSQAIGGRLEVQALTGHGTRVTVRVPA